MSAAFPSLNGGPVQKESINADLLFKLTQFEMQFPQFIEGKVEEIASKMLQDIKNKMAAANYPQRLIDRTVIKDITVTPDGFAEFEIFSELDSEGGFDIATAFEKGTQDHRIEPINARALSWIQDGKRFFSKGHEVKGITAKNIITDSVLELSTNAQNQLNTASDSFFEQVVNQ